jgi:hypothetical protein
MSPTRFALLLIATVSLPLRASEPLPLSRDEFKMYRHYQAAIADPRVQKMKPEVRLAAIAKDSKYKLKDLTAVIAKGDEAGDLKAKCESNLKEALEASELKGRLGRLEADLTEEHGVAYVQWLNEKPEALPVEASVAAATAVEACPLVSTIQVWAMDKGAPKTRVFQGLIGASSAANIKVDKAKDFAVTRYLRLFEKVKSVTQGDDLSGELGEAKATASQ